MIETNLEGLITNVEKYHEVVTLVIAIAGIIVTCIKVIANICATAMASPIEVTLMSRKEQHKYIFSNFFLVWFIFSFIFIYTGVLLIGADIERNSYQLDTEMAQVENAELGESAVTANALDEDKPVVDNKVEDVGNGIVQSEGVNKEDSDVVNAWPLLIGFSGIMCVGSFFVMLIFIQSIMDIYKWFKLLTDKKRKEIKRICCWCIVGGIICTFLVVFNRVMFWLSFILIVILFFYFMVRKKGIKKTIDILLFVMYIFFCLMLMGANVFVWKAENATSLGNIFLMVVFSVLLAFLLSLYFPLATQWKLNPRQAKVMYYNENMNKNLFLYFKYNEEFLVAGEKRGMDECQKYYLIRIDEIMEKNLKVVSNNLCDWGKAYIENIVLQLDGEKDVVLSDVIAKLSEVLQKNEVNVEEYSRTRIYIKQREKMVYFYLPNEKIDRSKQNFSLQNDN